MKKKYLHFTIAQLIEKLKSFPQDLPVLTSGYEGGYENLYSPRIRKLEHKVKNKYWEGEFQVSEKKEDTFDAVVLERVLRDV